jgi:RNA recognition motif-containing protein
MSVVYIGNLDENADARDLRDEFDRYGRIRDVWIARNPPGFAFVEFDDDRDAKDAVRGTDGRYILDKRVRVEISRKGRAGGGGGGGGGRDRDDGPRRGGNPPQRTEFKVKISNLPDGTNWRDIKDHVRNTADPVFADVTNGGNAVAEFRTLADAERIVDKLDDTKFNGSYIRVTLDMASGSGDHDRSTRDRSRSRSRDKEDRRDRSRSN